MTEEKLQNANMQRHMSTMRRTSGNTYGRRWTGSCSRSACRVVRPMGMALVARGTRCTQGHAKDSEHTGETAKMSSHMIAAGVPLGLMSVAVEPLKPSCDRRAFSTHVQCTLRKCQAEGLRQRSGEARPPRLPCGAKHQKHGSLTGGMAPRCGGGVRI